MTDGETRLRTAVEAHRAGSHALPGHWRAVQEAARAAAADGAPAEDIALVVGCTPRAAGRLVGRG